MHPKEGLDPAAPMSTGVGAAVAGAASAPGEPVLAPVAVPERRLPLVGIAVASLVVLTAASATGYALYLTRHNAQRVVPGLVVAGEPLGGLPLGELPGRVHALSERFLAQKIRLHIGRERPKRQLRELGMRVDEARLCGEIRELGHSGDPARDLQSYLRGRRSGYRLNLPVTLDEKAALDYLMELKDEVDRAPIDARLDLEKHTVAPELPGYLLRVYDSLVSLEYAARALRSGRELVQAGEVELAVVETAPTVRREDLKEIDVSMVLATWETRYSSASIDNDRTYNLKVGADKLNGYLLRPGQVFSFNQAVGDRTEKEGYRVAPVIQGGELIDGLAGGMCQIASTLHAAAFFAGLDIVRSTPHSRPSTYIPMGLDSTVVYPSVDLKLKNPFDFPVVIHYMVNQGTVKVELLGKQRPFKVAYEREILAETPFPSTTRQDPEMPVTQKWNDQDGYPGYRIKRRRYLFTGKWKVDAKNGNRGNPDGLIAKKEWDVAYPPTTEIVRVGTGPATLKKKDPPPSHKIPALPAWAKPLWTLIK
ncbi:MAG: VanW family protein [Polyangia bacterium]